jgi:RND superfamily putative drug exporter
VKEGSLAGEQIAVEAEIVVGREDADVVIEDPELSRRHARLRPVDGAVEIEDLGSRNGTWVNGTRIGEPARLAPGDVVRIGLTVLEVPPQLGSGETIASPALTQLSPAATVASAARVVQIPVLVVSEGPLAGERIPVTAELVLGREDVDVIVDDEGVSRRHLRVRAVGGAVEIEDLGSRNGTWLNGERITGTATLAPGDALRLGDTVIELEGRTEAMKATPPAAAARRAGRLSTEGLARAASRRPWLTVGAWVAALVLALVTIVSFLGSALTTDVKLTNDPESLRAEELLAARLPDPNEVDEVVVVRSETLTVDDAAFRSAVEQLTEKIQAQSGVESVQSFYDTNDPSLVSEDRDATLVSIALQGGEEEGEENVPPIVDLVEATRGPGGIEAFITGEATGSVDQQELSQSDLKKGELAVGLPAALIILALVFGALVAASIPLILALTSIVITMGLASLVGQVFQLSFFITNMVTAMGLALGIDYSLFVLSRYREERAHGRAKADAIAASGATASRAVFFSGLTFVIALLGMLLVPLNILRSLAAGAILVGIVAVVAALTLLPALLALLGDRVNAARVPVVGRAAQRGGSEGRFWSWAARRVMARPVASLVAVVALLLAAAVPVLDLDIGANGISVVPDRFPSKQGYLALQEEFPTATATPLQIVVDGDVASPDVTAAIDRLETTLAETPKFGRPQVRVEEDKEIALLTVPIGGDPLAKQATDAVRELRAETIPPIFAGTGAEVLVGGESANRLDYFTTVRDWLPIVFAVVLGLSFILLTVAFRSIVIPVKAILLNLLSVGAAYGLLVLVFQKGVGAGLLGFTQVDAIEAWVPLFLFSVLFGLSMDYHVFLLSRIREHYTRTGDNTEAVAYGVSSTSRLITGAALIIIAVFTGFALGELVMFQQMGFGVGVALLLDATIVRSVLLPASMRLLGDRNWYLPSWLSWLPEINVEGERRAEDAGSAPAQRPY